jgi:hypothetical protein
LPLFFHVIYLILVYFSIFYTQKMGFTGKAASLFLLAGSLSTAAASAGSWPTSTSSSSSSSTSSTSSTDTWTTWPAPTDPSSSTSSTSYLATITPCPWCPSSVAPAVQNVTQQLQTLSTCSAAVSACYKGRCHTSYPYSSWQWVSTTIPCSFNNFDQNATTQTGSSCLVTKTEECVPVSEYTTTVTSYTMSTWTTTTYATITPTPSAAWGSYSSAASSAWPTTVQQVVEVIASPVPVYEYIEKDYCAVFSGLGPLAMLDHYDGSGLCTTCGVKGVGLTQEVSATECHTGYGFTSTSCSTYAETWTSRPAPPATVTATQVWSSQFSTDGSWDITFTGVVPAQTVSAPYGWVTSEPTPVPWAFHGSCSDGPTVIDFTTTVTSTITISIPWTTPTDPYHGGWGDWNTTPTASANSVATGYVQVADPSTRYHKHDGKYVSFSGEDGTTVSGNTDAATFVYDNGYLLSDGEYITCDGSGYSTFEKSVDKPATGSWVINGGEYGALSCSNVNFCESGLGSLFIEYDSTPSFTCPEVWLVFSKFHCLRPLFSRILIVVPAPISGPSSWVAWPTSTTTTATTTTTTTSSTTTGSASYTSTTTSSTSSTTPDPSSDPDSPEEPSMTPGARVRRRRAMHKGHHARY